MNGCVRQHVAADNPQGSDRDRDAVGNGEPVTLALHDVPACP